MGVNKIFAVAITDYDDTELDKLENCYDDLSGVIGVLSERYLFDDVEFIYEKSATTRKELYRRLNEYFVNTLEDDNILLLFAGHGQYNEKLEISYWQPSDADPSDPSSWINVNDVLAFIKAANAFHIGIISDSCFSGAIFEASTRGGGIDALKNKKSREALTSGGIEKVSDGKKGEKSPFAKTLIDVLSANEKKELPFSVFSNNVIMQFDQSKRQTPMSGSLNDSGHEGGTFFFELKPIEKFVDVVSDKNLYLKQKLANLFIPIEETTLAIVEKINEVKQKKNEVVKAQRFEEAASFRDQEKVIEEELTLEAAENLKMILADFEVDKSEVAKSIQLDSDVEGYKKEIEQKKMQFEKELLELKESLKGEVSSVGGEFLPTFVTIGSSVLTLAEFDPQYSIKEDPAYKYFNEHQSALLAKYNIGILEMYRYFKIIQGQSQSQILAEKEKALIELISKVYSFELEVLKGRLQNLIDESIQKKEIQISVLEWIRNK